jgi:broad specificity phosphatase PhoE
MAIRGRLQRKPFWAPIGVAALSALAAALLMAVVAWLLVTARSTTVIVVRHAETSQPGGDPPLSPAGQARADLLARMFGDSSLNDHVNAIYVSAALRSRATAQPLANRLGLATTVAAEDDPRAFARRVLREHRGGRILVVGHSDTLPRLVEALSGFRDIPPIPPTEYGTLYIVTVPRVGRANLLSVEY